MKMDENYQYALVEKLSFLRYGGTEDERRAAEILMAEIEAAGGKGEYMEFKVAAYDIRQCVVRVGGKELEAAAYGCSGELPEGGADLKLYYAGRGVSEDYLGMDDLSDTCVLLNELNFDAYKLLCEKKAAAFITINGKYYDSSETSDLVERQLRAKMLENGKVPGFSIWASDATELVRAGVKEIHLELRQQESEHVSRDILAVIPGTENTKESVAVTAHYDSVRVGTGSWDNATGAATILYIYRYFLQNPPRRTIRFIWCGSEEQGLCGSKAYVEQHPELVEKEIKFCFNFDMCGTVLGPNLIFVTGGDDLVHFAEQFCREDGMSADIKTLVHSSDSAPFCDKGIPALGLSRGTKTAEIHTRHDLMFPLSAAQLKKDGDFAVRFISRVVNAAILPVPTGMPDSMKESLDKYFQRDKIPHQKDAQGEKESK